METDLERRLRTALTAEAQRWDGRGLIDVPRSMPRPARAGRGLALMAAAASAVAGLAFAASSLSDERRTTAGAGEQRTGTCVAGPARRADGCSAGAFGSSTAGQASYLPPGYSQYSEILEPVPTGSSDQIDSLQRRYGNSDGKYFVVTVLTGDVPAPSTAVFGGRYDDSMRATDRVVVASGEDGSENRYLWSPRERVTLDVDFVGSLPVLPVAEMRRVVAGIRN